MGSSFGCAHIYSKLHELLEMKVSQISHTATMQPLNWQYMVYQTLKNSYIRACVDRMDYINQVYYVLSCISHHTVYKQCKI